MKGNRLAHPGAWRTMPPARLAGTAALAWLTRHAAGLDRALRQPVRLHRGLDARAARARSRRALAALRLPQRSARRARARGLRIGEAVVRPVYRGEASGLRAWHLPPSASSSGASPSAGSFPLEERPNRGLVIRAPHGSENTACSRASGRPAAPRAPRERALQRGDRGARVVGDAAHRGRAPARARRRARPPR